MNPWYLLTLLALGSLFALAGLRLLLTLAEAGFGANIVWFVVQVSPIFALLPGVLRRSRTALLLCILLAFLYFAQGIWLLIDPELRKLGLSEVFAALALVVGASYAMKYTPDLRENDRA